MMQDPFFFGYGSLVNRATHGYRDAVRARISGWRRVWRHTALRPVAYLTAEPAPGFTLDGLIAAVLGGDWTALDQREYAYDRHAVGKVVDHELAARIDVHVYAIPKGLAEPPDIRHPILLSYLDTVVQGYLREFGPAGAEAFFATTGGWDAPVLNDRDAPRYPRAQMLDAAERDAVDAGLKARGVRRILPG